MLVKAKAKYFLDTLSAYYPDAQIELCFNKKDPWQLLVAVALSAQTTDKAVNKVTPDLFKAYPTVKKFAKASVKDVEGYVKTLGFFRNKAKNLVAAAQMVLERFKGKIPKERKLLENIPGVGPKTAAVIIANAFGTPAIAVDTHVGRVGRRLGLTKQTDPSKVEAELTALFPKKRLLEAHHVLIFHGRRICFARKPKCLECPVVSRCPRVGL
ncbi:MAG: endonuclease III [Deltaproteobacteria bacterium]|nr:endonuclease III [Deltaproteobacteria bacterium]